MHPLAFVNKLIGRLGRGWSRGMVSALTREGLDLGSLSDEELRQRCAEAIAGRFTTRQEGSKSLLETIAVKGLGLGALKPLHQELMPLISLGVEAFRRAPADLPEGSALYAQQILAATALTSRSLVEMETGEGKTYAILPAAFALACRYQQVYIVCASEYLAWRDAKRTRSFWQQVGLPVGLGLESQAESEWGRRVVYTTLKRLIFKELMDAIRSRPPAYPLTYGAALLDEADAILLDQGADPYSVTLPIQSEVYDWSRAFAICDELVEGETIIVDRAALTASLTEEGEDLVRGIAEGDNAAAARFLVLRHTVELAYVACKVVGPDRDYIVEGKQAFPVERISGRVNRNLTPAWLSVLETYLGLGKRPQTVTLNTLRPISFMRSFAHLSGTSGTIMDDSLEFFLTHRMWSVKIAPRFPREGVGEADQVFRTGKESLQAAKERALEMAQLGRPVLIGTQTIADAEAMAGILHAEQQPGVRLKLLTGRDDSHAASIFESAGQPGSILVATQLAGRGVDIRLTAEARDNGGLDLISLGHALHSRHDRQFLGRAGRHGDPFSAVFICSLEDALFKMFGVGTERVGVLMTKLGMEDGEAVEAGMVTNAIKRSQRQAENRDFMVRRSAEFRSIGEEEAYASAMYWFSELQSATPGPDRQNPQGEFEAAKVRDPEALLPFLEAAVEQFLFIHLDTILEGTQEIDRETAERLETSVLATLELPKAWNVVKARDLEGRSGTVARELLFSNLTKALKEAVERHGQVFEAISRRQTLFYRLYRSAWHLSNTLGAMETGLKAEAIGGGEVAKVVPEGGDFDQSDRGTEGDPEALPPSEESMLGDTLADAGKGLAGEDPVPTLPPMDSSTVDSAAQGSAIAEAASADSVDGGAPASKPRSRQDVARQLSIFRGFEEKLDEEAAGPSAEVWRNRVATTAEDLSQLLEAFESAREEMPEALVQANPAVASPEGLESLIQRMESFVGGGPAGGSNFLADGDADTGGAAAGDGLATAAREPVSLELSPFQAVESEAVKSEAVESEAVESEAVESEAAEPGAGSRLTEEGWHESRALVEALGELRDRENRLVSETGGLARRDLRSICEWSIQWTWLEFLEERERIRFRYSRQGLRTFEYYRLTSVREDEAWNLASAELPARILSGVFRSDRPHKLDNLFFLRDHQTTALTVQPKPFEWESFEEETQSVGSARSELVDAFLVLHEKRLDPSFGRSQLLRLLEDFLERHPVHSLPTAKSIQAALESWAIVESERGVSSEKKTLHNRWLREFLVFLRRRRLVGPLPRFRDRVRSIGRRFARSLSDPRTAITAMGGAMFFGIFLLVAWLGDVLPGIDLTASARHLDAWITGGWVATGNILAPALAGLLVAALVPALLAPTGAPRQIGMSPLERLLATLTSLIVASWMIWVAESSGAGFLHVLSQVFWLSLMMLIAIICRRSVLLISLETAIDLLGLWLSWCVVAVAIPLATVGLVPYGKALGIAALLAMAAYGWQRLNVREVEMVSTHLLRAADPTSAEEVTTAQRVSGASGHAPFVFALALTWVIGDWGAVAWVLTRLGVGDAAAVGVAAAEVATVEGWVLAAIYFLVSVTWSMAVLSKRCHVSAWRQRLNQQHQLIVGVGSSSGLESFLRRMKRIFLVRELVFNIAVLGGLMFFLGVGRGNLAPVPLALILMTAGILLGWELPVFLSQVRNFLGGRGVMGTEVFDIERLPEPEEELTAWQKLGRALQHRLPTILLVSMGLIEALQMLGDIRDFLLSIWTWLGF